MDFQPAIVKHKAFRQEVFVHKVGHDRDVLQLATRVGEADIDIVGLFILDQFQNVFVVHKGYPFLWSEFGSSGWGGLRWFGPVHHR